MHFFFPLVAVLGESIAKTIDRFNLSKNKASSKQLMFLVFASMLASLFLFIFITKQKFPQLSLMSFGLVCLIVVVSFTANLFDFRSLKRNDLALRQPLVNFKPIMAGFFGYLFFPEEREIDLLISLVLGAIIVYWGTHQRKLNISQEKGMVYLLFAIVLYALLPSIYSITLKFITPEYIALFRVFAIFLLTLFISSKKHIKNLNFRQTTYGIGSGILYAIVAIASLHSIAFIGVVPTMLLFLLGSTLRFLSGHFILKERVKRGEAVSSLLLACIILLAII